MENIEEQKRIAVLEEEELRRLEEERRERERHRQSQTSSWKTFNNLLNSQIIDFVERNQRDQMQNDIPQIEGQVFQELEGVESGGTLVIPCPGSGTVQNCSQ